MSLASKYRREITAWDWKAIVASAKANPQENDNEDGREGWEYLGSVMSLYPSGKYYLPFACSNVAGDCPTCKGVGTVKNRHADLPLYESYQTQANEKRDRLMAEHGAWCNGHWPQVDLLELARLDKAIAFTQPTRTCPTCQGCGSLSTYRDEVFGEVLESIAESHGGSITNGEGDPTDVFFVIPLEVAEYEEDKEDEA